MKVKVLKLNNSEASIDLDFSSENVQDLEKDIAVSSRVQNQAEKQGTKHVKTRSEVRGHAAKPFRQKGTGRGRQGSTKGPHHVGGGIAHGPMPDFTKLKLNKKYKKLILKNLITDGVKNETFAFLELSDDKKNLSNFFKKENNVLVVYSEKNKNKLNSVRNMEELVLTNVNNLSIFDLVNKKNVFVDVDCKDELINILK